MTFSGAYFESKRDTYMDLANYCLMQVLVMGEAESTEQTEADLLRHILTTRINSLEKSEASNETTK